MRYLISHLQIELHVFLNSITSTVILFCCASCSKHPVEKARPAPALTALVVLSQQRAWLLDGKTVLTSSPICSGRKGFETPTGVFNVSRKERFHRSTIYGDYVSLSSGKVLRQGVDRRKSNPPSGSKFEGARMDYYIQFKNGIGFHCGTITTEPSSHGCIRLPTASSKRFFDALNVGSTVEIRADSNLTPSPTSITRPAG